MDHTYWQRLQAIFDEVVDLAPRERSAYLDLACGKDDGLRSSVLGLLEANDSADSDWNYWNSSRWPAVRKTGLSAPYQAGEQIGHYRLIEQIGVGGMGIVYQALDTRLQRNVALKFLPVSRHDDERSRERFMTEARSASKLDHPNICVIHDVDETPEGHLYITMPHYEGETLEARLKRGRVAIADALPIAIQVADGLAAAHAREIVHRDIKPGNVMLTGQGVVKILDFGIAKVADAALTGTGMGIGTLAYMAPEQLHGQDVDGRTDIWALGVTIHEMLTGKTAFDGESGPETFEALLDADTRRSDGVSGMLHSVLGKALQRNRAARYEDVASLLEDLIQAQALIAAEETSRRQSSVMRKPGETVYEWDPEFIDGVIDVLTPVMGPIASKVVRRRARHAHDVEALCAAMADLLPNEEEKRRITQTIALKAATNTAPPAPDRIAASSPSSHLELTPIQMARLEACLLPYLGPIAATVIRHASAAFTTGEELARTLSDNVTNPDDRASVLQRMEAIVKDAE